MARPRKHDKHLPRSMYQRRGAYYFVRDGKWHPLGRDYGAALTQYAQLIGRKQEIHTVHDAVWHYIESSRARLAPATVASYEHSAARLVQVFGQMRLGDVLPSDVYEYLRKHGNVQANRDRALLSAAYSEARRIGAFPKAADDPTKGLEYRNPERPRDRYVTDAELSKVLAHASPKLATIARFIELTGMRPGDALRVRPGDVRRDGIHYRTGKTGRRIVVGWSRELRRCVHDALMLWRRPGQEWLFESRPKGTHAGRGLGPYTPSGIRAMWRRATASAGLPDIRLYDLRGKAGSDAQSDAEAQDRLGHTDARVTRRHYRRRPTKATPTR